MENYLILFIEFRNLYLTGKKYLFEVSYHFQASVQHICTFCYPNPTGLYLGRFCFILYKEDIHPPTFWNQIVLTQIRRSLYIKFLDMSNQYIFQYLGSIRIHFLIACKRHLKTLSDIPITYHLWQHQHLCLYAWLGQYFSRTIAVSIY